MDLEIPGAFASEDFKSVGIYARSHKKIRPGIAPGLTSRLKLFGINGAGCR